jgi:hypothetical protein
VLFAVIAMYLSKPIDGLVEEEVVVVVDDSTVEKELVDSTVEEERKDEEGKLDIEEGTVE